MNIIYLDSCDSTNSWLAAKSGELEAPALVTVHEQRAGRGQRGNSWEAEPGMNFTGSMFWRPKHNAAVPLPVRQGAISEATALAVADTLREYGVEAKVKWPNDIYADDKKICGILIEHALTGARIEHSRLGIGVNVNQKEFRSDAPNPVSLTQLIGERISLTDFTARLYAALEHRLSALDEWLEDPQDASKSPLHEEYLGELWRADGAMHPFRMRGVENAKPFMARILTVLPEGPIVLEYPDGSSNSFFFKEIEFILH